MGSTITNVSSVASSHLRVMYTGVRKLSSSTFRNNIEDSSQTHRSGIRYAVSMVEWRWKKRALILIFWLREETHPLCIGRYQSIPLILSLRALIITRCRMDSLNGLRSTIRRVPPSGNDRGVFVYFLNNEYRVSAYVLTRLHCLLELTRGNTAIWSQEV